MNILLASSSSGSHGGGEIYLVYLGQSLAARGHQVTLWASDHPRIDELAGKFAQFGTVVRSRYRNTYDLPGRSLAAWLDPMTPRRVAVEWGALEPDVLHINKQNLEDGLDLLRAAAFITAPSLCTVHLTQTAAYLRARLAFLRDFISRRALRSFPGPLVAIARQREIELREFAGAGCKIAMIPNGVPLPDLAARAASREKIRAELGIAHEALLIAAVGRLEPQKQPLRFLQCVEKARQVLPEARFVWVGDGRLADEWDSEVAERRLREIVQRLPWRDDVESLLLAADAFFHVAEYEGLPLALLEAMGAGLPVFVTPHLRDELPFLDEAAAVTIADDAWLGLLNNRDELARRGAAARALAERDFSHDKMAARHEQLYRELIAGRP